MSSLTRAQIESRLIVRCGTTMALVGLDGTTRDGTNDSITDPLREGLRTLGFDVANPVTVTDTDVAPVTGYLIERLLGLCELSILQQCVSQWYRAVRANPGEENKPWLDQALKTMQLQVTDLQAEVRKPIRPKSGVGVTPMGGANPSIPNTRGLKDLYGFPYK